MASQPYKISVTERPGKPKPFVGQILTGRGGMKERVVAVGHKIKDQWQVTVVEIK